MQGPECERFARAYTGALYIMAWLTWTSRLQSLSISLYQSLEPTIKMSLVVSAPAVSGSVDQLKKLPIENRLFINGEFVPSKSGRTFEVVNPATEKVAASVFEADAADVDDAVAAAKAAFPAWSELPASERGAYLFKLADALEKHLPELAYLDAISMGKPVDNDSEFWLPDWPSYD